MKHPFGTLQSGAQVERIALTNNALTVFVLTYGAILQDVRLAGVPYGLTLGSPDLAAYTHGGFHYYGAVVGPVANRIANARAMLDEQLYRFESNENGKTCLHSGACGLHRKNWSIAALSRDAVTLTTHAPAGEGGFPGNRHWSARFALTDDATLTLTLQAQTDADTWINTVNHSYWNLDGAGATDGHSLTIAADHYLPVDKDQIPTGAIAAVAQTPYDFRSPRVLRSADQLDHNFCLNTHGDMAQPALTLTGQKGISLTMYSSEPGMQVYDGRGVSGAGLDGQIYGPRAGIALEAQGWPDALNQPEFPTIVLKKAETRVQTTQFRFTQP